LNNYSFDREKIHMRLRASILFILITCSLLLSSCNLPTQNPQTQLQTTPSLVTPLPSALVPSEPVPSSSPAPTPTETIPVASSLPPITQTLVTFRVRVPTGSPQEDQVFLTILDEVTGLAINPQSYAMSPVAGESGIFTVDIPLPMSAAVPYRYERRGSTSLVPVVEHLSDGKPVLYRLFHVEGPATVEDVVSAWTDLPFSGPTGRIYGQVFDRESGQPLSNILISVGGNQTLSRSDGSFLVEGLSPGVHNLVGYALDGSHRTFQQGALVAEESTTPAEVAMQAAPPVSVMFIVKLPENTPPAVPVRLAGNLFQLGNLFANLPGGVNTLAANMPALAPLPDGRYTLTLNLPAGANVRYKYTLGDGFWNAERTQDGGIRLRQFIVPEENLTIEDAVDTWNPSDLAPVTFDVTVPTTTVPSDAVYIQFRPIFGWTEPLPMWWLGNNRWAYMLLNPLDLPGTLTYRYCRNGQCGSADDVETPGIESAGRLLKPSEEKQLYTDNVKAWVGSPPQIIATQPLTTEVYPRSQDFMAGIEFRTGSQPSWRPRLPVALETVKSTGANWIIYSPSWTFTRSAPPVFEPVPAKDPFSFEVLDAVTQAHRQDLKVALYPKPGFPGNVVDWWQEAPRDFAWWLNWFEQYRAFALHFADLAEQSGAATLVLGGDWLAPALPGGLMPDGSPSGVPADAENRWRSILSEVRSRFSGTVLWATPYQEIEQIPVFIDSIDGIYLLWFSTDSPTDLRTLAPDILDNPVRVIQLIYDKPIILGFSYPAGGNMEQQAQAYQEMLKLINERDWISGFVSRGFLPPAPLQESSASINGKPSQAVLSQWYPLFLINPAP
jgi:hypothetical protein